MHRQPSLSSDLAGSCTEGMLLCSYAVKKRLFRVSKASDNKESCARCLARTLNNEIKHLGIWHVSQFPCPSTFRP